MKHITQNKNYSIKIRNNIEHGTYSILQGDLKLISTVCNFLYIILKYRIVVIASRKFSIFLLEVFLDTILLYLCKRRNRFDTTEFSSHINSLLKFYIYKWWWVYTAIKKIKQLNLTFYFNTIAWKVLNR